MAEVSIAIPRAGQATVEGTISQWLVADGASVTEGQTLYALETDKVEMEVAAPASGVLSIAVEAGGPYDVGTEIGRITTA
ncbi:MAG: lipoyl domain-containing protein [Acidobacteria bacterium]|nr:lipoyl domain-containing protein [Acidobacteriota bacterium]